MFERKKYKKFAITQLSGRWTVPVLITLLITIISIVFSLPSTLSLVNHGYFQAIFQQDLIGIQEASEAASQSSYLTTIIQMIVAAILEVASLNVYLKMSRSPEPVTFGNFIEGLNNWARATLEIKYINILRIKKNYI